MIMQGASYTNTRSRGISENISFYEHIGYTIIHADDSRAHIVKFTIFKGNIVNKIESELGCVDTEKAVCKGFGRTVFIIECNSIRLIATVTCHRNYITSTACKFNALKGDITSSVFVVVTEYMNEHFLFADSGFYLGNILIFIRIIVDRFFSFVIAKFSFLVKE